MIVTSSTMGIAESMKKPVSASSKAGRLHYLDWLRVILLFGVFLYHVLKPFDPMIAWHINNAEKTDAVMAILMTINPWGIPLFYMVSGAGSWFALRHRSNRQYVTERVNRLLLPLIIGSILLSPFQRYLEALHQETFQGSFFSFIPEMISEYGSANWFTPAIFGRWGLHLWFLGFLFAFSLLALPIFNWLKRSVGASFTAWLGRLVEKRGAILLFILPLALIRALALLLAESEEHGWVDLIYFFFFFVMGYIIYSDDRFVNAVRRDRWLLFASGIVGLAAYFVLSVAFGEEAVLDWGMKFVFPGSFVGNLFFVAISWGWALLVLYVAMKYLNFSNRLLVYGNETIMPFYLLHQPVIIVVAYFVVQWDAGILVKLLAIGVGSLLILLGLIELLIRPFRPMRRLFGMRIRGQKAEETRTALA
jgi:peptidoglycan/LPS O-acetylase OafA/YrhL